MDRDIIEVNKSLIPYSFDILLEDELFTFGIDYNKKYDVFIASLEKNGDVICEGEPLVYGMPLFKDMYRAGDFPAVDIVPLDISGQQKDITYSNFGDTVFLTIDNMGGDADE